MTVLTLPHDPYATTSSPDSRKGALGAGVDDNVLIIIACSFIIVLGYGAYLLAPPADFLPH